MKLVVFMVEAIFDILLLQQNGYSRSIERDDEEISADYYFALRIAELSFRGADQFIIDFKFVGFNI